MHTNPFIREVLELAASGRKRQALDRLKRLQAAAPDDLELHLLVGGLSAELGDADSARSHLAAVLARQPAHFGAARTMDGVLRQAGTPTNRATLWRRYVAAAPGDLRGRIHYIDALLAADDPAAADEQRGQLALEGADPTVHLALAQIYHQAGIEAVAVEHYRHYLAQAPDDPDARRNYAAALQTLGAPDEAAAIYEALLADDPGDHVALVNLGTLRKEQDRLDEALALYRRGMLSRRRRLAPAEVAAAGTDPGARMTTLHSLRLEREQLAHLADEGVPVAGSGRLIAAYDALIRQLGDTGGRRITLTPAQFAPIGEAMQRLLHLEETPALEGGALNPDLDYAALEAEFLDRPPGLVVVDDFLRPEALLALRRYCQRSTVWFGYGKVLGYCGAYMQDGFGNPLLLQLAADLRRHLPRVVGPHRLNQMWGYIYDSQMSGITAHADPAAVNVNFWIVPDEANLDPERGGLVVSKREAPAEWDFRDYNNRPGVLEAFMNESERVRVPYRCNRMVMFNSNLVHRTDEFRFRPGLTNRRINVTMLFGDRRGSGAPAA